MSMPQGRQAKAFGVAPAENRVAASTTPLPPIGESPATVEDELVRKSPTAPMMLDTKTVLPPISSGENLVDGSEKVVEIIKSSSSMAEPLPPITAGPPEAQDVEATEVTSGAVESGELTMKENTTPLPPITSKQADSAVQFGDVYFVLGQFTVQFGTANFLKSTSALSIKCYEVAN